MSYCFVVHFRQSLSAVVGPNGSGKSNVIDAMLFVFGKRAKQVIFNCRFIQFHALGMIGLFFDAYDFLMA